MSKRGNPMYMISKTEGAFPDLPPEKRIRRYRMKGGEPGYDGNPPKFTQTRGSEVRDPKTGEVIRAGELTNLNLNIDRVSYLFHHKLIEQRQYDAAQKLERDWELSEILPVASSVLVGASSGQCNLPNDDKVAAMKRFGKARDALGRWWHIVEKIVIEHKSIGKASAELRIHEKRGVERFDCALHLLADHYRIS